MQLCINISECMKRELNRTQRPQRKVHLLTLTGRMKDRRERREKKEKREREEKEEREERKRERENLQ